MDLTHRRQAGTRPCPHPPQDGEVEVALSDPRTRLAVCGGSHAADSTTYYSVEVCAVNRRWSAPQRFSWELLLIWRHRCANLIRAPLGGGEHRAGPSPAASARSSSSSARCRASYIAACAAARSSSWGTVSYCDCYCFICGGCCSFRPPAPVVLLQQHKRPSLGRYLVAAARGTTLSVAAWRRLRRRSTLQLRVARRGGATQRQAVAALSAAHVYRRADS